MARDIALERMDGVRKGIVEGGTDRNKEWYNDERVIEREEEEKVRRRISKERREDRGVNGGKFSRSRGIVASHG